MYIKVYLGMVSWKRFAIGGRASARICTEIIKLDGPAFDTAANASDVSPTLESAACESSRFQLATPAAHKRSLDEIANDKRRRGPAEQAIRSRRPFRR